MIKTDVHIGSDLNILYIDVDIFVDKKFYKAKDLLSMYDITYSRFITRYYSSSILFIDVHGDISKLPSSSYKLYTNYNDLVDDRILTIHEAKSLQGLEEYKPSYYKRKLKNLYD